jgi:maltose alpha-D-glucosyltransferase/alpha-amylase
LYHPAAGIVRVEPPDGENTFVLCEATWDKPFWRRLLATIGERGRLGGERGAIAGIRDAAFPQLADDLQAAPPVYSGERRNATALFDDELILKLYRRVTPGVNPDLEISRQLTERDQFAHVPRLAGSLEYRADSGQQTTIAVLHEFVPNVGDAWTWTLDELARYFEGVQSLAPDSARIDCDVDAGGQAASTSSTPSLPAARFDEAKLTAAMPLLDLVHHEPPPLAQQTIGGYLYWAELLGRRTGELHAALAGTDGGPAFAPEPFTRHYQRGLYQSCRSQARTTFDLLRTQSGRLDDESRRQAQQLLRTERTVDARFSRLRDQAVVARRIRCHGDFHLGRVLFTGKDFLFIGFEGPPERPVSERRLKASPLRDVAAMLRSFHYAAHAALRAQTPGLLVQHGAVPVERWAPFWTAWVSAVFLRSYLAEAQPARLVPTDRQQLETLLSCSLLEKAMSELRYELDNRPDWAIVPLDAILQLLD